MIGYARDLEGMLVCRLQLLAVSAVSRARGGVDYGGFLRPTFTVTAHPCPPWAQSYEQCAQPYLVQARALFGSIVRLPSPCAHDLTALVWHVSALLCLNLPPKFRRKDDHINVHSLACVCLPVESPSEIALFTPLLSCSRLSTHYKQTASVAVAKLAIPVPAS